jgi:hypothetical protein
MARRDMHCHDVFSSEGLLEYCFTVAFGCNPLAAIGTMTANIRTRRISTRAYSGTSSTNERGVTFDDP